MAGLPKPADDSAPDAALERLAQLEAEQAKEFGDVTEAPRTDDTDSAVDRATEAESKDEAAPSSDSKTDTESSTEIDKAKSDADSEGKELVLDDKGTPTRDKDGKFVKQDKKPANESPITLTPDEQKKFTAWQKQVQTKYGHDLAKKLVRWDNIKTEETRVMSLAKQENAKLQSAIAKFNQDVQTFRSEQQAAAPAPEKYEAYAEKCRQTATLKKAEATLAEQNGDFDKAEALKQEALLASADADRAVKAADHARKNPPLDAKKQAEQFQIHQKSWIDKAAIDFPEFAKKDSSVQKEAAQYFREMVAKEPAVAKLPGFIYYAAERAALKMAAEKVPALEKEVGELRTKVKDLDALTNPVPRSIGGVSRGGSAPKKFEQLSAEEQYEQLRKESEMIGR